MGNGFAVILQCNIRLEIYFGEKHYELNQTIIFRKIYEIVSELFMDYRQISKALDSILQCLDLEFHTYAKDAVVINGIMTYILYSQ